MLFLNILILSVALVVQGKSVVKDDSETPELEWPETYTFQALRIYVSGGFSEDLHVWRTPKQSRVDYNNGAVKSIIDKSAMRWGIKYKIRPETDKDDEVTEKCTKVKGDFLNRLALQDVLPNTYGFEQIGTEYISDVETQKWYYVDDSETNVQKKQTIWAIYDEDKEIWIPKKYETAEYNTWFGSEDKHEIWEFNNFETDVKSEYFDAEDDCEEETESFINDNEHIAYIDPDNNDHVDLAFESYKQKYNKNYEHDQEHELRRSIFKRNLRMVQMTNRQNLGYKLTINQFSDKFPHEMKKYTGLKPRPEGKNGLQFPYTEEKVAELAETLPKEYDTRLNGLVGTVKKQEECGSCWTFGTTVAIEGAVARHNGGKFVTLSNQAILDCAWSYGAYGCDGGSDTAAYGWIADHGIPTQAEYGEYVDREGYCHIENMTTLYKIGGFVDVSPNSIEALKLAVVNHGPLSVSVNADTEFGAYSSGIFYSKKCNPAILNHEVALVGYGEENGETYWILKNSWGPEWGIDGYMHISARDNVCGVASEPSYPIME